MDRALPDDSIVETALAPALRAPSRHNVQPWRWQTTGAVCTSIWIGRERCP